MMKHTTIKIKMFVLTFLLLILNLSLATHSFSFDINKIFFAGDSSTTHCRKSIIAPDSYFESLFSRLQSSPPPGFIIEPSRDIRSLHPCSILHPNFSGYGGLKILDWNTECTDASGGGVCSWSCSDCPLSAYDINRPSGLLGFEAFWCCCASRRSCIDQSDAQYVILNLLGNDLLQLFKFYGSDVDQVVEEAKLLTNYITAQGRKVIWLTSYPLGYGNLGNGESPCSDALACLFEVNSNAEYFYEQFLPWITSQSDVYLIDFFRYIKETYAPNPISFINKYGYDGIHLKPSGHQIYYDFVYPQLVSILAVRH
jgi:lysophospholipase L1-like esterase